MLKLFSIINFTCVLWVGQHKLEVCVRLLDLCIDFWMITPHLFVVFTPSLTDGIHSALQEMVIYDLHALICVHMCLWHGLWLGWIVSMEDQGIRFECRKKASSGFVSWNCWNWGRGLRTIRTSYRCCYLFWFRIIHYVSGQKLCNTGNCSWIEITRTGIHKYSKDVGAISQF